MRGALRGAAVLLLATGTTAAYDPAPAMGRYMPYYPGMYLDAAYARDERDSSFDAQGERRDSAETTLPGKSSFPESRVEATFRWYFPVFESYEIPLISDRLYTARVQLRYVDTQTQGAMAAFVADPADDADTEADDLRNNGSGIGDLGFQFGTFLWGSQGWRENQAHRFALVLLAGASLPVGHYERDAPVSAGTNTFSWDARLAFNARPWSGGFIDGAYGIRNYFKNQDAAFGGLHPSDQGNDRFWDFSVGQRVLGPLYLTAFASGREGDPNTYERPRFSPNQPDPPTTVPPSDNIVAPERYEDQGTSLTSVGGALSWFLTQRWLLGLHYTHPIEGKSGEFDMRYQNRQPAGCNVGSTGCQMTPGPTVRVDGMGPARAYASDRVALTLTYNFGQGDAFTCQGCR